MINFFSTDTNLNLDFFFLANILNSQILFHFRVSNQKQMNKKTNEYYPTGNESHISMIFFIQQSQPTASNFMYVLVFIKQALVIHKRVICKNGTWHWVTLMLLV